MQTADEQIFSAAQESLTHKSERLNSLAPHARSPLYETLQSELAGDATLAVWLGHFAEGALLPASLDALNQSDLERLYGLLNSLYVRLYPAQSETAAVAPIQKLELLSFDSGLEEAMEGFELLDLGGPAADAQAETTEGLKEPLWLLLQLLAAYYFVHHIKA